MLFPDDGSHHIISNYPVKSKQCDRENATYISCDRNELIMDITAVSTVPRTTQFGDCDGATVLEIITSRCFLKSSCYVSTSAMNLDSALDASCSMPNVCLNVSYVCKRMFLLLLLNCFICKSAFNNSNARYQETHEEYPFVPSSATLW
jgi:hypothetical protein